MARHSERTALLLGAALLGACRGCPSTTAGEAKDGGASPSPSDVASAPADAVAPTIDASASPVDAGATSRALADALAGTSDDGVFWIPVSGAFIDEDLLLEPDGRYVTHLHERPASSGTYTVIGDTLTLEGYLGDGRFVVEHVTVRDGVLRGVAEGAPLVMKRFHADAPRRGAPRKRATRDGG